MATQARSSANRIDWWLWISKILPNPAAPELQAKLLDRRLGKPNRCVVEGNRAYLPMVEGDGIAVVDLSNPAQPAFLTAYHDSELLHKTYGVAVRGSLLYVASREENSLIVLNRDAQERK
jgi:hypothetical protein